MPKESIPFGTWPSQITPRMTAGKLRLSDVQYCEDGLIWLEGRTDGTFLVKQPNHGSQVDISSTASPRGGLAYGGGEYHCRENRIAFSGKDGRIHFHILGAKTSFPVTPSLGSCASPCISPDGKTALFLHSDGQQDSIGLADLSGDSWPVRLAYGADFYMQPAWHPSGLQIAWVEWNNPNMAWDGSQVILAQFDPQQQKITSTRIIAGDDHTPVFQPEFSPDGQYLTYMIGSGDTDSLMLVDLLSGDQKHLLQNRHLLPPAWVMGMRVYAWAADSGQIFCIQQNQDGAQILIVDRLSGKSSPLDMAPYTTFSQLATASTGNKFVCLASSPVKPQEIIEWSDGLLHVLRSSLKDPLPLNDISIPQPVQWKNNQGETIYGLYFPPIHSQYTSDGLPPAVIHIHGGPTSFVDTGFSFDSTFFTNRGYAVLAVNYRGSSGYGRQYQQALNGHWGDYDVEDTISGTKFLVQAGLANPAQLVLKGGSAGGYTLLNTLIRHPGIYKAAICSYPVVNLQTIINETFKFEAHYYDSLIGPYPEEKEKYLEWSPIMHIHKLTTPMLLFHGDNDPVVPKSQSDEIITALKQNHIPHTYKVFQNEGHGWKQADTIETYYSMIDEFLQQFVITD